MKDNKLLTCGGCITLVVVMIVCISAFFLGAKTLLWSGVALIVGIVIGNLLGGRIGIAGGGSASSGAGPVGLVLGLVCVVIVNWYLWASDGWWKSIQPRREVVAAVSTQLPISLSPVKHLTGTSYDQIENSFQGLDGNAWQSYKRKLIGAEIDWSGVVASKKDTNFALYLGQDKLSRRIYVFTTPEALAKLNEREFVKVQGRISEIDEILGLSIYIADATVTKDDGPK